MATIQSAFNNYVSDGARSFFIDNIPDEYKVAPGPQFDLTRNGVEGKPGEFYDGTSGSDYVILGNGDHLAQGVSGGYDVVQTGNAISLKGTDFEGIILTDDANGVGKNVGATGNALNNNIAGNSGNNHLKGEGGDDVIAGNDGNDRLDGGDGNDTLFGDAGDDVLLGGKGVDSMEGGIGADKLAGGDDNDTLLGDAGNDSIWGDAGDDSLDGGAGDDSLDGGQGDDSLFGGADDDFLSGMQGDDSLFGGEGSDTLFGSYGSDTMTGDGGADIFVMKHTQADDVDVITDFDRSELDVIDLSGTGVKSFEKLKITDDTTDGNAVVSLPDGSKFKLIGYTADQVDDSWFHF